jgi:hypothetical protein
VKYFKYFIISALIIFYLIPISPVFSQETEVEITGQISSSDFFLLPILEIIFSQNIKWRPDWPSDIPPDGFTVHKDIGKYEVIELSGANASFTVKYDREGWLLEFPYFYFDGYAEIKAVYSVSGALSRMNVTLKNYSSVSEDENSGSEEKNLKIIFPDNFLPFSGMSPGGAFPAVSVEFSDTFYYVYIFESPVFLSETWFDHEGNMLFFCKANVNIGNNAWRISSMEIQDTDSALFIDYSYDSYSNITQIKLIGALFLSLYNEGMPSYWRNYSQQYELFWDTQNLLTVIKAKSLDDDIYTEYRYEYDFDNDGNWINRKETAYIIISNLLTPSSSYSRGIWNRRVVYFD